MKNNLNPLQSSKYQALVQAATGLFLHHGIKKVTVEEICEKASVSKMTFYKHFKNKIDLALFIMNGIFEKGIADYKRIMDQDVPYSEKAKEIIKMKLEASEDFSKEMLKDCYDGSVPELTEMIQKISQSTMKLLLDDFIAAQEKGEIRKDINPNFFIYMIEKMRVMAADNELLNMYGSIQDMISEIVNFFFYGILSGKEQ